MNLHKLLLIAVAFLSVTLAGAYADDFVNGYQKKDGTYVPPHYRSSPDKDFGNNWSTKGNENPYTGKEGTRITPPPGYGGSRSGVPGSGWGK